MFLKVTQVLAKFGSVVLLTSNWNVLLRRAESPIPPNSS